MLKAKDFRQEAWAKLAGKWGVLAVTALIYSLITGALAGLSVIGVGAIAEMVVIGPLTVSWAVISLNVIRMNYVELSHLFCGFKNFLNSFVLCLLNEIFIMLWSLLFIVPGIIKSYSYSMSYFILADNPDMAPNDARKLSMQMMVGNKWRLFCLDFSFIGWNILCVLTAGILSYWIMPYQQAARAAFYQSLISDYNAQQVKY